MQSGNFTNLGQYMIAKFYKWDKNSILNRISDIVGQRVISKDLRLGAKFRAVMIFTHV